MTQTLPTRPSLRAYQLTDAIADMTTRYGTSEREGAYAWMRYLHRHDETDLIARDRYRRAANRQRRAVNRLARALRDLDGGQ